MREKQQHDNPLLPLKSRRMNEVASTGSRSLAPSPIGFTRQSIEDCVLSLSARVPSVLRSCVWHYPANRADRSDFSGFAPLDKGRFEQLHIFLHILQKQFDIFRRQIAFGYRARFNLNSQACTSALPLNFLARPDDLSRRVSVTISLGMVFFLSFSLGGDWRKIPCYFLGLPAF